MSGQQKYEVGATVSVRLYLNTTTGTILGYVAAGDYYMVKVKGNPEIFVYSARELEAWN